MTQITDSCEAGGITYEWLGQSTVRMTTSDGYVIYTDPVFTDDGPKADLILITHHHVDHCLPEYVAGIRKDSTEIGAFHPSYVKHCAHDIKGAKTINIGDTVEFAGALVTGVEAYTKRGFHMKGEGCGFLLEIREGTAQERQRVYFSGDTTRIEEMKGLGKVDVAIVSVADNAYAIKTDEVVEGVRELAPSLFIPVHFTPPDEPPPVPHEGMFSSKDARYFTSQLDPARFSEDFEGTGILTALLKKIGRPIEGQE